MRGLVLAFPPHHLRMMFAFIIFGLSKSLPTARFRSKIKPIFWDVQRVLTDSARVTASSKRHILFSKLNFCRSSELLESTSALTSLDMSPKDLVKEVQRQHYRTLKKLAKANENLDKCNSSATASVHAEFVQEDIITSIQSLQYRLKSLKALEEELVGVKESDDPRFQNCRVIAADLGISGPPQIQEKGPKKLKGKPSPPRLPFYTYTSSENIQIRVGRSASDNDLLSCDARYRDGPDWWMHVSGDAGSHVVIRSHDEDLPTKFRDTVLEAALLAASESKSKHAGNVVVTLTRCRFISKPAGAKPGLVRIANGADVLTVSVNLKNEERRLDTVRASKM